MSKQHAPVQKLLVEGQNDRHVIWALCQYFSVPQTFAVEEPNGPTKGIQPLLASIPVRLKTANLTTLGMVVDADDKLDQRWQAIRDSFLRLGYDDFPLSPQAGGLILTPTDKPRIGVWVMPDNRLSGNLEDFVGFLIDTNDPLKSHAAESIDTIEREGWQHYRPAHRSKALVHTWLAWQDPPGMPLGQAITAKALDPESLFAKRFVDWIQRLFTLSDIRLA